MAIQTVLALGDILLALVFFIVSLPLALNKVPPNPFYGIRLPKAFLSDENWYRINQYGGKVLALWSLPLFALGVLKLFVPADVGEIEDFWAVVWMVGPIGVCFIIPLIQILIYTYIFDK